MNGMSRLEAGLWLLDAELYRPRMAASYLMIEGGRAAFIETGTSRAVPRLLRALEEAGCSPAEVDWVIVTHVHLDHAGGAGLLMQHLPNARLVVHPRGARHLIGPEKLWSGATAVYGAAFLDQHYGELVPVPAARVHEAHDGELLCLGERELHLLFVDGHARHHLCVHDPARRGCFTGDAFGLGYPELQGRDGPWLLPSTSPVQLDPIAMHASIDRIAALEPEQIFLTHFGPVGDVARQTTQLHQLLDAYVVEARRSMEQGGGDLGERLEALFGRSLQEAGCDLDLATWRALLAQDTALNADGLRHWLKRLSKSAH